MLDALIKSRAAILSSWRDLWEHLLRLGDDLVAEHDHQGRIQNPIALEDVEPADTLPAGILMQHLHSPIVGTAVLPI